MGYYPVFLEVSERPCLMIGGGAVAQRRVEGLLAERAKVTVVSPAITDGLAQLVDRDVIRHIARVYQAGDLAGFELAFVATDDLDVNQSIFSEARLRGVWINSADDPENCDFLLPAVVRRGNLSVAVCTGGASPAATRAIREELDTYFTFDYALLVRIAGEVRKELKDRSIKVTPEAWNQALRGEFRRLVAENRDEQAKTLLLNTMKAHV